MHVWLHRKGQHGGSQYTFPHVTSLHIDGWMLHVRASVAGAVNAANDKVNAVVNTLTGEEDAVPATARYYKSKGLPWVVIGEWRCWQSCALGVHCTPWACLTGRFWGGGASCTKSRKTDCV